MDEARVAWLAGALDAGRPTLVAMHHPPFATGIAEFDRIGLPEADRAALVGLLGGRPEVLRIVSGHIHRALTGAVGGVPAIVAPSSWRQLVLDLRPDAPLVLRDGDPPGYALHLLAGDGLVSHAVVL
jgi:3',5'-cyclic-AMP phosphodiesterase